LSPPLLLCPSKILRHGNKNTLYREKALNLFENKNLAKIQLPVNDIQLLSIPQRFAQNSEMI
jgi:hypothetical protein